MEEARVQALAREVSAITRREPTMLHRPPRQIARAIREGRWAARFEEDALIAFLFWHPYGAWAEIGTGYVNPPHRGQGIFAALHEEAIAATRARGLRAFGFPGTEAVEREMRRQGFVRAPYSALPPAVWLRFLADRASPAKALSNLGAIRAGARRTLTRLYVLPAAASRRR